VRRACPSVARSAVGMPVSTDRSNTAQRGTAAQHDAISSGALDATLLLGTLKSSSKEQQGTPATGLAGQSHIVHVVLNITGDSTLGGCAAQPRAATACLSIQSRVLTVGVC
jgi:uncharacterized membrane protein YebE (DUF533 family)